MRAVVTRVASAAVAIEGRTVGAIDRGFLVLLGVGPEDTQAVCDKLAEKVCNLRVLRPSTKVLVVERAEEMSSSRFSRSLHTASMVVG